MRHVILYITVQHRLQLGKEDDCSSPCMHACVCKDACIHVCIFVLYTCMHTPQTTPHHTTYSLIRFIDSGVFLQDSLWSAESTTTSQSSLISMAFDLHLSHTCYLCTQLQLTTTPLTSPCCYIYDCDRVEPIVHGKVFGMQYADKSVTEHNSDPFNLLVSHKLCCLRTPRAHLKRQREAHPAASNSQSLGNT